MSTSDPEELRAEIAQTRAELGATVEALAAKVDVKTRAKRAVADVAGRARQKFIGTTALAVQVAETVKWRLTDPSVAVAMRIASARRQAVALRTRVVAVRQHPQRQRSLPPVVLAAGAAVVTVAVLTVIRQTVIGKGSQGRGQAGRHVGRAVSCSDLLR